MPPDSVPEPFSWQELLDAAEHEDWRQREPRDLDEFLEEVQREVDAIHEALLSPDDPDVQTLKDWHELLRGFYWLVHKKLIPAVESLAQEGGSGGLFHWFEDVEGETLKALLKLNEHRKNLTSDTQETAILAVQRLWTRLEARRTT